MLGGVGRGGERREGREGRVAVRGGAEPGTRLGRRGRLFPSNARTMARLVLSTAFCRLARCAGVERVNPQWRRAGVD